MIAADWLFWLLSSAVTVIAGAGWLYKRWSRRQVRELVVTHAAEFRKLFPGRCVVCSFHEYSVRSGVLAADAPVHAHRCVELLAELSGKRRRN